MIKIILIIFIGIHCKIRESSSPFISGDSFRNIATWIYDEDRKDNFEKIGKNEIIFLKTDYLKDFFNNIHPQIKYPYILITHNSDYGAPYKYEEYLDDPKIICWFAQNPTTIHDKLIPIPIGIQNQYWEKGNLKFYQKFLKKNYKAIKNKEIFIYMNLADTHQERSAVKKIFIDQNYCKQVNCKPFEEYLIDLDNSVFVLSPRGNGLDCHRTWEVLLAGSIPVVKTSVLDKIYENLPVMIVKDWKNISIKDFNNYLTNLHTKKINLDKIYFEYWKELIYSKKLTN